MQGSRHLFGQPLSLDQPDSKNTNQNLNDSPNRFENGSLTDSLGLVFIVIGNGTGANFTVDVVDRPGGVKPAAGAFTLVDDDLSIDGADVPMPDTSTLPGAMAEAYVKVLFDVGDTNDNVPFVLNISNHLG
jgi:hypothetical protein